MKRKNWNKLNKKIEIQTGNELKVGYSLIISTFVLCFILLNLESIIYPSGNPFFSFYNEFVDQIEARKILNDRSVHQHIDFDTFSLDHLNVLDRWGFYIPPYKVNELPIVDKEKRHRPNTKGYFIEDIEGVVFLKFTGFYFGLDYDISHIINELSNQQHIRGIIIDLRSNTGGYLKSCVDTLDLFLDSKFIIKADYQGVQDRTFMTNTGKIIPDNTPIIIMVNDYTASASEIFTGVMKDLPNVIIFGENTFGKSEIQIVQRLPTGGILRLTTGRYYFLDGTTVSENGIKPDVYAKGDEIAHVISLMDNMVNWGRQTTQ